MADDQGSLFEQMGAVAAAPPDLVARGSRPPRGTAPYCPREEFLAGMLAQWAADDRERGAKPIPEEKRRARAGARAALGEITR